MKDARPINRYGRPARAPFLVLAAIAVCVLTTVNGCQEARFFGGARLPIRRESATCHQRTD